MVVVFLCGASSVAKQLAPLGLTLWPAEGRLGEVQADDGLAERVPDQLAEGLRGVLRRGLDQISHLLPRQEGDGQS